MIGYETFKEIELKIATIKEVEPHPQADRLYVLTVEVGDKTKQIVAGIRKFYEEGALRGRQIVIVDNLETALIRGVESQGMLLAASDNQGISLLGPDRKVADGVLVK